MNKIKTTSWEKYKLTDLFDIILPIGDIQAQKMNDGEFPLVSSGKNNNGICKYISATNESNLIQANSITVDMFGKAFFQPNKFYCVSHGRVNILIPKFNITKNIGLFLSKIIEKITIPKYEFLDMCSKSALEKEVIQLPSNNNQPNWEYMEAYMKNVMQKSKENIINLTKIDNKSNKIKIDDWQEFEVSKLFTIKAPSKRSIKTYEEGPIPYISSSGTNNGVVSYLKPQKNEILEKGNCITVSPLDGSSFYQEYDFLGRGGAGSAISMLYNKNITKYNALFISTIIKNSAKKYDYNDAFTSDNLKFLKIKLPLLYNKDDSYFIDKEKKYSNQGFVPDWEYMEKYMKNIINKTQMQLDKLVCC